MAPRRRTALRAARRSAALALLLGGCLPALAGAAHASRFSGRVTDALRNPAHRLLASAGDRRASADLLFVDSQEAHTTVRTCVVRRGSRPVCFDDVTDGAGVTTVTPLRFRPGRYVVRWSVAGQRVARWRFAVVRVSPS